MTDYSSIFIQSHCVSKAQLLSYVRDKLDKEEAYLVESHLNDCQFCNDALDGLMEEDMQQAEQNMADAKQLLQQSLFPKIEPEQKNAAPLTLSQTNGRPYLYRRLMIAASVLLLIGFAGYTVFSYIQSHKAELALNKGKKGPAGVDAEYSKADDEQGEIVRLKVEENDTFRQYANEKAKNPVKNRTSVPALDMDKTSNEEVKEASDKVAAEPDAMSESKPSVKEGERANVEKAMQNAAPTATVAENDNIVPSPGMENFARGNIEEKVQTKTPRELSKKKSVGGLKYDNNVQSNQMNYQRGNNNDFVQQRSGDVQNMQKQTEDEVKNDEKTSYERALTLFNNKKYKRSIALFEKALQTATAAEKEDIMYYLAQAYENTGRDEKAIEMYTALSKSKKYRFNAEKKIREAQPIELPAKKK